MPDGVSFKDVPSEPREKRPLFRPLPPAPEFPARALGALLPAAEAIQQRTQAPFALCAQSVLAAATLAAQPHYDVILPHGGQRPLTGFFVSVADSGERKSTVDKLALGPVYRMEETWRAENERESRYFSADHAAWKAAAEKIKKAAKGDRALIRDALLNLGAEPKPPPPPMLLLADPTPEALVLHLAEGRPWGGVFTDEGGLLIGGAAFSDESRMRTAALFNALWDGSAIRRRRVLTGSTFLPGRRCTAHVMLQPVVAQQLFGDELLDGIGMLARALLVAPESTAGNRPFVEATAQSHAALAAYADRITALLTRKTRRVADNPDALDPLPLHLSAEARALWIVFYGTVEARLLPDGGWRSIMAFGAKVAEHAGRIAAVLSVYDDPDATEIGAEAMACGCALAGHYATELLRLQGAAKIAAPLRRANDLLTWWKAQADPRCYLVQIYQRGPNAIREAAAAKAAVATLEAHGLIRRLPPGTELDGAKRNDAWELVP
jgi:hypothetical protein